MYVPISYIIFQFTFEKASQGHIDALVCHFSKKKGKEKEIDQSAVCLQNIQLFVYNFLFTLVWKKSLLSL